MILKSVIQCHAVKVATVTSNIERPTSNKRTKVGEVHMPVVLTGGEEKG